MFCIGPAGPKASPGQGYTTLEVCGIILPTPISLYFPSGNPAVSVLSLGFSWLQYALYMDWGVFVLRCGLCQESAMQFSFENIVFLKSHGKRQNWVQRDSVDASWIFWSYTSSMTQKTSMRSGHLSKHSRAGLCPLPSWSKFSFKLIGIFQQPPQISNHRSHARKSQYG